MSSFAGEFKQCGDTLRVLLIEDNPQDVELCLWALKKGGFKVYVEVTNAKEEFADLIRSKTYDVILSDFNLRDWTAVDAIQILQDRKKDVPFVLVTGSLGDEAAVECIKKGVSDYVLKDRMARLPLAVRRALEEKAERDERAALEEQLRQSQKMEAIGRLAGGVAHDFNNLLTIVSGYSELLLERLDQEDPMRPHIEEIKKAGDRAASLTRQLLAFSRKQVMAPQVVDLNRVVAGMNRMLQRLIGEDVELVAICCDDLWRVKADPGQIEQVIMNLAVNARDAMPKGGRLTIETANVELDETYSQRHLAIAPGPYVMLAVSDTGDGMDTATQARVFEPFFTTKEQGKGTGLGLATVYGIVKQSGGYIWLYSEPGEGATFKIYLPRAEGKVPEARKTEERVQPTMGSETILVVEDDEAVRGFVRGVLQSRGHTLLEAGNSNEALSLLRTHQQPIQLLLTDVVMPQMSGRELAQQLLALQPKMKVLFMSGYTDNAVVQHGALEPGTNFLQKPFSPERLMRKVREILDAES